jgi:hypothetical protein|tara:strand:- start:61 stop:237 length:177 start_codon:yes stop_codon:yes gene_type:complete
MRNKQLVHKKLEKINSSLLNIGRMVRMGESKEVFQKAIESTKETVEEVAYMVEQEREG